MPQGVPTGTLFTSRGFWTSAAECVGSIGRNLLFSRHHCLRFWDVGETPSCQHVFSAALRDNGVTFDLKVRDPFLLYKRTRSGCLFRIISNSAERPASP